MRLADSPDTASDTRGDTARYVAGREAVLGNAAGPYERTLAYRRGVRRAVEDLRLAAVDGDTVTVTSADRSTLVLCRLCGWARPGRCVCEVER